MSASPHEVASRRAPKRGIAHDERAVSEVVGQILILGILTTLLITVLWGFAYAKDNATERAVIVRGDAMLQSISSTAVQAALFAEENSGSDIVYKSRIDLPTDLEGHAYTIDLAEDEVFLLFPDFDAFVSSPLFRAGAGSTVTICDQAPIAGGPVILTLRPENDPEVPAACSGATSTLVLYLEPDT